VSFGEIPSFQEIADLFEKGVFIFDSSGNLAYNNEPGTRLTQELVPNALILSIDDFCECFSLPPARETDTRLTDTVRLAGKTLKITRALARAGVGNTWIFFIDDVSGRSRQQATVHKQASDLLWKVRSKMTPIQNALSMLCDDTFELDQATGRELLTNSRFEMWQLERYLDNFRDLFLIQGNQLKSSLTIESCSFSSAIDRALENLEVFRALQNVEMKIEREDNGDVSGLCDRMRLVRIVETLLLNSMTYASSPVSVTIRTYYEDTEAVLQVEDNGYGISPEDAPRIFTYGFRGKNSAGSDYNGMGTELYLAQHILLACKGTISFQSKQKENTIFCIELAKG